MPDMLTYAVGDIHGCYTKLRNLIDNCRQHCGERTPRFVFLGDYVDRGTRSRDVVMRLMELQATAPGRVTCLKGNHEAMLIAAAGRNDLSRWIDNGGDTTLRSYGVNHAEQIPADHLAWLAALPTSSLDDRRFFAHAGIMPGVALDQQVEDDLIWIREPFLSDERDHGRLIVHGHTPLKARQPDLQRNRLNLDTGAVYGGPLTAAVFEDASTKPLAYITDTGTVETLAKPGARAREWYRA
jgi:serine/threonine protein phosphatase 1